MNIIATIVAIAMSFMGLAGGGGSSSGGGGGGSSSSSSYSSSHSSHSSSSSSESAGAEVLFPTIFIIIVVAILAIMGRKSSSRLDHNSTAAEKKIHHDAEQIFMSYQSDWSEFQCENIKKYTTPSYCEHASLMLELLKNLHRTNKVSGLKIHKVILKTPVPDDASFPLRVNVTFSFSATDEVFDTQSNARLYHAYVSYGEETWNFIYDGTNLKLDGISQPTESAPHLVKSLASFARDHHLFYSPDWGRYALPARGLIFGGASMKVADINNHVIGRWGDLLVQLYTYAPTPDQSTSSYYLVGQLNVPKDYLGVIVRSRKLKPRMKPDKSYEKFEMEWNDFNERYEVFAASRDALPAFELLNPKFMELLYSKNPSYSLEVVDNIIYIYANVRTVTEADYASLLEILEAAHHELKM